jgi:isoquinoline 1-oxidoreductase subunit beta
MTTPGRSIPALGQLRRIVGKGFRRGEMAPTPDRKNKIEPTKWFDIPPDGPLVMFCPKAEIGQGIGTAFSQIAAEELGLQPSLIEVRYLTLTKSGKGAANARGFGSASETAASRSISGSFRTIQRSAAALRVMLIGEAAQQFGVPTSQLTTTNGVVHPLSPQNGIAGKSYATIVADAALPLSEWPIPKSVAVKATSEFTIIGTDVQRIDVRSKLVGEAVYGFDAALPDMAFGCVAHPPRYGARIAAVDATVARTLPGVLDVVVDINANFLGVVATTRVKAQRAVDACGIEWAGGTTTSTSQLHAELRRPGGPVLINKGNAAKAIATADQVLDVEYLTAPAAHAHLEPICALANVTPSGVELWVPTQRPTAVAAEVSKALNRTDVTVHQTLLGSGFGRKFMIHAATDAARLSNAVGRPVHVAWTPQQDLQSGPFRPPTLTRMRGTISNNRIVAVDQYSATGSVIDFGGAAMSLLKFHPGAQTGIDLPYEFPNYRVAARLARLPVPTGIWRSVGLLPNIFAVESFVDELAALSHTDPLEFRLTQLPQTPVGRNLHRLLSAVAAQSGWNDPLPDDEGRGIACAGMAGTLVAAVVRVRIDSGGIRVRHVHVCADPGLVINPAGATLQIVGGVMMGISSALHEEITFANGMAVQTGLDSYQLLRAADAPVVDVQLMGTGEHPSGLGEPAIGPIPAAIANAVFAASGNRLRSLPLRLPTT